MRSFTVALSLCLLAGCTKNIEQQKRAAEATLKAIDDLNRAHGVNQANEAQ